MMYQGKKPFFKQRFSFFLFAGILLLSLMVATSAQAQSRSVNIAVDMDKPVGNMDPVWAWFGYDEPNYTYMKDGKKLLSELAALSPVPVFVRTHNMLTTGNGEAALKWGSTNAYTEDKKGRPIYNWHIADSIFDTYVQRGMKPLAQIGFMPEAMSVKPQPYRHHWQPGMPYKDVYTGWSYPPKDYKKWAELVYQWVRHCVDRYGKEEVESWYWEVWNEPNISYWQGTQQDFFKLYDYSADAVKRALPTAKIGGPDVAGTGSKGGAAFLTAFIQHCIADTNYVTGKIGSPLDLISFHAKGAPRLINGTVRMNVGTQLRDIETGFKIVASYPQTKNLPIIIGESDPEGCAACGMQTNPENAYRNGTMYSSYTAASFARKYALADSLHVNFLGAVSWSFEFEDQPWFFGFRDLATNGVDKPVLNVFRMLGMMQGKRIKVVSSGGYDLRTAVDSSIRGSNSDVSGLASRDDHSAAVLLWNYHDDDVMDSATTVEVRMKGMPAGPVYVSHYRIDKENSNSYEVWKGMGSPQNPSAAQIKELEKSGQLALLTSPEWIKTNNGEAVIKMKLPRQAVSLLKFTW